MSARGTLDPDADPERPRPPPGHDAGALGPSDLSDTGSDSVGSTGYDASALASDGDSTGNGVDLTPLDADGDAAGADIGFDRIVGADEAGLDGGLDQAEEARRGVTDAESDPFTEAGSPRAAGPPSAPAPPDERRRAGWGEDARRGDADGVDVQDDGDDRDPDHDDPDAVDGDAADP